MAAQASAGLASLANSANAATEDPTFPVDAITTLFPPDDRFYDLE